MNRLLHTHRFDHGIRALAAGRLDHVQQSVLGRYCLGSDRNGKCPPLGYRVDDNNPRWSIELRANERLNADRACTQNGDGIPRANAC